MYFKDKRYYINKAKEYAGLILSAVLVDVVLFVVFIMA